MNNSCGLQLNVSELRQQEVLCDVVIKVGKKTFPCHRVILASAMQYFRNMFAGPFIETGKQEIELKGVRELDFELLLSHVYGNMVCLNDSNNAYRLLRISHYLDLNDLDSLCTTCIQNSEWIPWKTAVQIFLFANLIDRSDLADAFAESVAMNFVTVSKFKKFLCVSGANLLKVFAHSCLKRNANATLDFLTNWMKIQCDEERKLLPELLHTLDLKDMPNEWIAKIINENIGKSNITPTGKKRKKKQQSTNASFRNDELFSDLESDVEISDTVDLPFSLYMRNFQDFTVSINKYKLTSTKTVQLLDFDLDANIDYHLVSSFSSLTVDEFNYFLVGFNDYNHCCNNYNRKRNRNRSSSSSSSSDSSSSSIMSSNEISFVPYIHYESQNYRLKPNRCTDSVINYAVPVACGTDIYLYSPKNFLKYNCTIDSWIKTPTTCLKTKNSSLVTHQGSVYMVGGLDLGFKNDDAVGGKPFQQYDPRLKEWSRLPDMIYSHLNPAVCVHNDTLYVAGGEFLSYFKGYIECYDFKAGKWYTFETSMPKPKTGHTLLAHNNGLWFFGGECYEADKCSKDLSWYWYSLSEHKWSDIYTIPRTYGKLSMECIFDVVVDV